MEKKNNFHNFHEKKNQINKIIFVKINKNKQKQKNKKKTKNKEIIIKKEIGIISEYEKTTFCRN